MVFYTSTAGDRRETKSEKNKTTHKCRVTMLEKKNKKRKNKQTTVADVKNEAAQHCCAQKHRLNSFDTTMKLFFF